MKYLQNASELRNSAKIQANGEVVVKKYVFTVQFQNYLGRILYRGLKWGIIILGLQLSRDCLPMATGRVRIMI